MGIKKINEWEKAVVFLLNLDGWDLEWWWWKFNI